MLLPFFLFVLLSVVSAAESKNRHIAVLEFDSRGVDSLAVATLSESFMVSFSKYTKDVVIERGAMKEILMEQGFQKSGCTSAECAVEMGRLLGATHMVAGSVGRVGETYLVVARLIDVETAKIERTAKIQNRDDMEDLLESGMENLAMDLAGLEVPSETESVVREVRKEAEVIKNEVTEFLGIDQGGDTSSTKVYHPRNFILGGGVGLGLPYGMTLNGLEKSGFLGFLIEAGYATKWGSFTLNFGNGLGGIGNSFSIKYYPEYADWYLELLSASYHQDLADDEDHTVSVGAIGAGYRYFLDPSEGLWFDASFFVGSASITKQEESSSEGVYHIGLGVGYEL